MGATPQERTGPSQAPRKPKDFSGKESTKQVSPKPAESKKQVQMAPWSQTYNLFFAPAETPKTPPAVKSTTRPGLAVMSTVDVPEHLVNFAVKNSFIHFDKSPIRAECAKRNKSAPPAMASVELESHSPIRGPVQRSPASLPASPYNARGEAAVSAKLSKARAKWGDSSLDPKKEHSLGLVKPAECKSSDQVARSADASEVDSQGQPKQCANDDFEVLTVMIRNIPCGCTEKDLREAIASFGFEGQYNYLYMPMQRARVNMGYAFLGFPETSMTKRFAASMSGYCFPGRKSSKVVAIVPARNQRTTNCTPNLGD